ncbi:MAG: YggS family pyridoxal phosphate-dependent enzyme [Steroidobacterales bacterium]
MLTDPHNLASHIKNVRSRIGHAAVLAGRDPASITLVAVTKTQPAEVARAAAALGVTDFGENYVREAAEKIDALRDLGLNWHFIGAIQANKTRAIAAQFAWAHSIDRLSVARRLAEQRPFHAPPLNLCIQVALVAEPNKSGALPAELPVLAAAIAALPRIRLRGLMCLPPPEPRVAVQREVFARLRRLLEGLNAEGLRLDTLSMGMSDDFEAAIAEGATHVRIGTALFGQRQRPKGTLEGAGT